jgi:tetratricopeptide (TPR) repeat protein
MHYSRFEFHAAILAFVEGKEHDPENFHCWYNLSSCFICLGRIPDAIKCLERAKKCELLFQSYTRSNVLKEREVLIGRVFEAQRKGKSVDLKINEVPILV